MIISRSIHVAANGIISFFLACTSKEGESGSFLHLSNYNQPSVSKVLYPRIQLVESADAEPVDMECRLYSWYYTILYKGLEHSQILVSLGALEPIPHGYLGNDCNCS